MTPTTKRGAAMRATIAVLVSFAALIFAPTHALADEFERLSSAPVVPASGERMAEHSFQVAQGKKKEGGGGGGGKTCPTGYADCDGVKSNKCESNLQTDVNNCGACGKNCGSAANATSYCERSICEYNCNSGFLDCDTNRPNGCEVYTLTDANNCGGCGKVCAFPYAHSACTGGRCEIGKCETGFNDCDQQPYNGCESRPDNDDNNCGACGQKCGQGEICIAGGCVVEGTPSEMIVPPWE